MITFNPYPYVALSLAPPNIYSILSYIVLYIVLNIDTNSYTTLNVNLTYKLKFFV